jgi:hypothetical protein
MSVTATLSAKPQEVILSFDIGIRNLAWCLLRGPASKPEILSWQNYDLLAGAEVGSAAAAKKKLCCSKCSAGAGWMVTSDGVAKPFCLRHCPASTPPLKDASGTPLKKLPPVAELRAIATEAATLNAATAAGLPLPKKTAARPALLEFLKPLYALPIERLKVKKAVEHDLALIHDAIRAMVAANLESFRLATRICLENQPVLKNPTMKTVQMFLYATLRDFLQPAPPPLKLVHAGKKVVGKTTGDAGYKSRKDASEGAVAAALAAGELVDAARWGPIFKGHAKKSDLADAFLMSQQQLGAMQSAEKAG